MTKPPSIFRKARKTCRRREAPTIPVFVYGTLKAGNRNAQRLAGSLLVEVARSAPRFNLFCLGYAPGMVPGGATSVAGEVYLVTPSTLQALDAFEGDPWKYRRTRIAVTLPDGCTMTVWTYLLRRRWVAEDGGVPVPSGTWVQPDESGRLAEARRERRTRLRDVRGGSFGTLPDFLAPDAEADAWAAWADEIEAEDAIEAFGYCPECGECLESTGECLGCLGSALDRWARD